MESPGRAHPVENAVLATLAEGPRTGWEIVRALEAESPGCLAGREGHLYPLLAGLERRGTVEGRWVEDAIGRPRREYALAGAEPSSARGPAVTETAFPADAAMRRLAEESTRTIPGAFERESARAEILGHLEASGRAWALLGLLPAEAARRAEDGFGDPWKIRTDLGRVHRGRPVVIFPSTFTEWAWSLAIYDLPAFAVLVALVVLLRWQVVQAYNIPTGSMEPTLHGDEVDPDLILVDKTVFRRRDPERWDIIVFYPPPGAEHGRGDEDDGPRTAFVKRCVGLGGDSLDILGGDLYVNGRIARRPDEVEEAMMVPVYDQGTDFADAAARLRLEPLGDLIFDQSWKMTTGAWSTRGTSFEAVPGDDGEARLRFLAPGHDGRIDNSLVDAEGKEHRFREPVGDAEVRFVVQPGSPDAVVGADLTEGEDRHSVRVGPDGLVLRSGEFRREFRGARTGAGRPMEIRLRNVDDRLTVWVDGLRVLREELPVRGVRPKDSPSAGVELVVEHGPASFEGVRIRHDVQYLRGDSWSRDDDWPKRIPEGCFFMMGDNTGSSRDSRVWGTVPRRDLVGVPFWVIFPPARAKVLR